MNRTGMITRERAVEIVRSHGWSPWTCTVSHTRDGETWNGITIEPYCESFNSAVGVHDFYFLGDVMDWLGY